MMIWQAGMHQPLLNGFYTIKLIVVDSNLNEFIDRRVVELSNVTISFAPPITLNVFRFGDIIVFNGTITGTNFQRYEIEYGEGATPANWSTNGITLAREGIQEVEDDTVASWDTSVLTVDGEYTLRITVHYNSFLQYTEEYIMLP